MISATLQGRTFNMVAEGLRELYFLYKPHWAARFEGPVKHRSIVLLSGRKAMAFRIEAIKDTGHSYKVTLGTRIYHWVKQGKLFKEPMESRNDAA